eukprot:2090287-Rhodomonas_salina.1
MLDDARLPGGRRAVLGAPHRRQVQAALHRPQARPRQVAYLPDDREGLVSANLLSFLGSASRGHGGAMFLGNTRPPWLTALLRARSICATAVLSSMFSGSAQRTR